MAKVGKVKRYDGGKKYGFIERDGEPDIFFHASDAKGDYKPAEKDEVSYDESEGDKGPKAINVAPVKKAPAEPKSERKSQKMHISPLEDNILSLDNRYSITIRTTTPNGQPGKKNEVKIALDAPADIELVEAAETRRQIANGTVLTSNSGMCTLRIKTFASCTRAVFTHMKSGEQITKLLKLR